MGGVVAPSSEGKDEKKKSPSLEMMAGALSGALARFVVAPLDVVKIRFQVQIEPIESLSPRHGKYTGVVQCMRTIAKEEGLTALWRGTVPGQMLAVPYTAIQFLTLKQLKDAAKTMGVPAEWGPAVSFCSGAIAGVAATVASYPFDLLRTTLAAQGEPRVYRGMFDAAAGLVKQGGASALFRGITPTIVEIIPYASLQFGLYDGLNAAADGARKGVAQKWSAEPDTPRPLLQQFVCGLVSGLLSKLATHPLDVVKKRYQVAGLSRDLRYGMRVDADTVRRSFLTVLQDLLKKEGLRGLYKGAFPSVVKAAPNAAVTFVSYELFLRMLSKSPVFDKAPDV